MDAHLVAFGHHAALLVGVQERGHGGQLVQIAIDPYPALEKMGIPMIWKWVKTEEQRRVLEFLMAEQVYGRPFLGHRISRPIALRRYVRVSWRP
jgi:hypothetical protein